ncbi:MAG: hypothetical protein ACQEXJ_17545 [Myxococcota bacterium]
MSARLPATLAPLALLALLASACDGAAGAPEISGTGGGTGGVAVVCSDYSSTAVALLGPDAREVLAPVVLHSGSASPKVQTALGGDVDLPTTPPPDGSLLLLDRFPNAVLTFVDPADGAVVRQVNVRTGFDANPHDALLRPGGRLMVTRHNPNPDPAAEGVARGDDLLTVSADGVPLDSLALTEADGFPARPDRMLEVGEQLWITLVRASRDWSKFRDGAIARVTAPEEGPSTLVDRVALPGVANCSRMARRGERIAVSCSGGWLPGRDFEADASTSAVIVLDPSGSEVARLAATDPRLGRPLAPAVVFDGDGRVVVGVYGGEDGTPDAVFRWDPDTDQVVPGYESTEPWTIGDLLEAADGIVVTTDAAASAQGVCRLGGESSACLGACDATGLPPRALGRFRAPGGE